MLHSIIYKNSLVAKAVLQKILSTSLLQRIHQNRSGVFIFSFSSNAIFSLNFSSLFPDYIITRILYASVSVRLGLVGTSAFQFPFNIFIAQQAAFSFFSFHKLVLVNTPTKQCQLSFSNGICIIAAAKQKHPVLHKSSFLRNCATIQIKRSKKKRALK